MCYGQGLPRTGRKPSRENAPGLHKKKTSVSGKHHCGPREKKTAMDARTALETKGCDLRRLKGVGNGRTGGNRDKEKESKLSLNRWGRKRVQ